MSLFKLIWRETDILNKESNKRKFGELRSFYELFMFTFTYDNEYLRLPRIAVRRRLHFSEYDIINLFDKTITFLWSGHKNTFSDPRVTLGIQMNPRRR